MHPLQVLREKSERAEMIHTAELAELAAADAAAHPADTENGNNKDGQAKVVSDTGSDKVQHSSWFETWKANTIDRDVTVEGMTHEKVRDIHGNGEVFDTDAEEVFKYLQVFTACCSSLAHGANDVANAIGPLAATAQIWKTGSFSSQSKVAKYALCSLQRFNALEYRRTGNN